MTNHALTLLLLGLPRRHALPLRTFGTGRSAFTLTQAELTVFSHNVSQDGAFGVMTHFWITGNPALGPGTDNATIRYYIDDEATPSIEFKPPMAAGVGFDNNSVWGIDKIGHASNAGGWYMNLKIPFQSSVRVTVALSAPATRAMAFVILRGCENLPVTVGSVALPAASRLWLHKIESRTFAPFEWVELLSLPAGDGLVYMTAIAAESSSYNFWEGCVRLYTPHDQPFPGLVLGTGLEDYFDSAYGFRAGTFHFPGSGCTHKQQPAPGGGYKSVALSAYRFHEEDPLAFSGGVRLVWRIGDYQNRGAHPESPKCYIDAPGPGDLPVGTPENTTITTYTWVYTF